MDRHRLRIILSIVLFSCDLVLTKEVIYKTLGSKVKLICPIETTRVITWTGPLNYKIYAVGTDVSQHVSTQVEINETAIDKKSILFIYRFTEDISGEFRCGDGVNESGFNLVIKKNPSDLVIVNATDDRITTVQGREQNLECRVTSGQPGGNITLSIDGAVIARNGPSFVGYRLIPQRSDNGKVFTCEAFNSEGESILESSVILEVFYIPKISFSPKQTLTVKENEQAQLICINDGNDPNATTVWKRQRTSTIVQNNCVLNFKNVKRTEAGLYTCMVDTKVGVYEDSARVIVQYAPTIDIEYFPSTRTMKCIPSGVPDSYVFKDWEHTTEYNDHIRFLATTKEGHNATLTILQNVNNKEPHQERGIYICRASNNISSTDGIFVRQKYNLNLPGTPHFVSSTENTQYGIYLETTEIKIKFVSVPEYTSYVVYKNGTKFTDYNESVNRNTKIIDTMYGKNVSVKGNILSLFVKLYTSEDFCSYKIDVKNAVGCTNYTIKLLSADKYAIVESSLSVVILSLVIIIAVPLVAGTGLYVRRLKQRYKDRMEPAINVQTPEGTFGESAHYTEIIEVDNLQPTSQENDNAITSMINRDIDVVSAEHTSTSSDNDRDSSEYLDDGYEQPYTTLMVTDQVKDGHVYLTTKQKSDYENAIPFQNVACGHACEFLEDSLSDKTNAHDNHEHLNLIYDVNDFNVKNDRVPQIYIYPQMNKAEYINLSLNQ